MPTLAGPFRALAAAALCCTLGTVAPDAARAQGAAGPSGITVAPGTRVRVTVPGPAGSERLVGTVVAQRGDTLVAQWETRDTLSAAYVALDRMLRLETSRGMRPQTLRGAGIGALAGAVVLGVAAAASYEGCRAGENCIDVTGGSGGAAAGGAVLGALGGGVVGAIIGSLRRSESWQRVSLERVAVAPGRAGLALAGRLRF